MCNMLRPSLWFTQDSFILICCKQQHDQRSASYWEKRLGVILLKMDALKIGEEGSSSRVTEIGMSLQVAQQ